MCQPHVVEHRALSAEKPCRRCGLPFEPDRANAAACPSCRALTRPRADAGKRRDIDSHLRRCSWCGDWTTSRVWRGRPVGWAATCHTCEVAA